MPWSEERGPSPAADQLAAWDRAHVWHAFTQMADYEPWLIERGEGVWLFDSAGRKYLDGVSSLWCNLHGHAHPKLNRALREQLDRVAHTTNLGASNPTTIRLARRLAELAPPGLTHVFFSDSGASAVEVALKLALQYFRQREEPAAQKTLYVAFEGSYHGDTLGGVSVSGVERFRAMFAPLLFEVIRLAAPTTSQLRGTVAPDRAAAHYLEQLNNILLAHGPRVAAVVVEPLVQAAAGMRLQPPGYLRGARELTRQHDVLLIADEVAVGFGRTGKLFACEHEQVAPDLFCLAKGLTGGYLPMAATLATDEIYKAFLGPPAAGRQFFHGHTYGGNPLAAAAALASLEIFEEERVLARLPEKIDRLAALLAPLAAHPHVGEIRQCGLMVGIELVQDRASGAPFSPAELRGARVCRAAREHGVWLRPLGDVVVILPPLSISLGELELITEAVHAGLAEVCP